MLAAAVAIAAPVQGSADPAAVAKVCHPTGHGTVVLKRVFIGARERERLPRYAAGSDGWFSKVGLLVQEGDPVELSTDPDRSVRLVGWDTQDPAHVAVIDESTPHDGIEIQTTGNCADEWNFYAGGFISKAKTCARLTVTVGTKTRELRFGLGRRCGPPPAD